eukprot:7517023-Alexandrium_andersonii.AAC.1
MSVPSRLEKVVMEDVASAVVAPALRDTAAARRSETVLKRYPERRTEGERPKLELELPPHPRLAASASLGASLLEARLRASNLTEAWTLMGARPAF